jgi:glycosyltransferase involved in cell wall biosynthesis
MGKKNVTAQVQSSKVYVLKTFFWCKENNMPKVSIGLPVYNGEKRFLDQAIESVLAQTFDDFEFIISDNASTDRTAEICKQYAQKDRRIRYYRNEKNIGISRNFCSVFELGTGEYFKWISDDATIEPTYLAKCVDLLDNDPSIILAHTKNMMRYETDNITVPGDNINFDLRSPIAYERLKQLLYSKFFSKLPLWGLMRSSVLQQTGLFRSVLGADHILIVELCLKGGFGQVPEHLTMIRRHPDAYTDKKKLNDYVEGRTEANLIDPGTKSTVFFPHWRRLKEFAILIINSKEDFSEQIKMTALLFYPLSFRWSNTLIKEVFFAIGLKDIWILMRDTIRTFSHPKTT